MACPHLEHLRSLQPPKLSQADMESGVDVCLSCFNGACLGEERHHQRTHFQKSNHPFTLNVRRTPKPTIKRQEGEEPPAKRLAIKEEREEDKYLHSIELKCWLCDPSHGEVIPDGVNAGKGKELRDAVMASLSSARQSEVKAWEEEITACEHTVMLQQESSGHIAAEGLAQCSMCELRENLWLCLTCGNLGCGRSQFGGVSGNGHALLHYNQCGHAPAVKLGTITPEGNADVYCYQCDDSRMDLELARHLATFGINVLTQEKTQKTMTELQIDQNFNWEFSVTDENGRPFEPLCGPGLTGLRNLGNSCYMASAVQSLFSLAPFQAAYRSDHASTCTEPLPASCLLCQLHKMHDGLLSGRYSHPRRLLPQDTIEPPKADEPVFQDGLRPSMFKALIGKGHEEFATMRQQDAEEFLTYLFKVIRTDAKKRGVAEKDTPPQSFNFGMEQRLQCGKCKRVRYKVDSQDSISLAIPAKEIVRMDESKDSERKTEYEPVELVTCLNLFTQADGLEYKCPSCNDTVVAQKQNRFATFPDILLVHAKKFQLVNWVPQKLAIPLIVEDFLVLDEYKGHGLQEGEEQLPEDASKKSAEPEVDQEALSQLEAMGFPTIRCKKALLATGGNPEVATGWLFEHMDDPDIDAPIASESSNGPAPAPAPADPGMVSMLQDMGFTAAQASKALRETSGNMERAVEWLFSHADDPGDQEDSAAGAAPSSGGEPKYGGSDTLPARYRLKAFISHKGPSVHSGHYVSHIRHESASGEEEWVLFNDEKVVKADEESVNTLKQLAYLYVFERV
ncbi:ubiquitinyl hydrolase [Serendipita vermifera]|nr:ubiquitinyl hydrolase [Serendipita vermifera]